MMKSLVTPMLYRLIIGTKNFIVDFVLWAVYVIFLFVMIFFFMSLFYGVIDFGSGISNPIPFNENS